MHDRMGNGEAAQYFVYRSSEPATSPVARAVKAVLRLLKDTKRVSRLRGSFSKPVR